MGKNKIIDFKNGVGFNDGGLIINYKARKITSLNLEGTSVDLYVIKLEYHDGTWKSIRVYTEPNVEQALATDEAKKAFFVDQLFGYDDGLIRKQQRTDYIYLGSPNKKTGINIMTSITNIILQKTPSQIIERRAQEMLQSSSFKNMGDDWDVVGNEYLLHAGTEDKDNVFKNGLPGKHDARSSTPFFSLKKLFDPVDKECEFNGLYDAAKAYGRSHSSNGRYVYVLRIPREYRGTLTDKAEISPPLPTYKSYPKTGEVSIIPNLIYGVYDTQSGVLTKNPDYNAKYDPRGLSYDAETIQAVETISAGNQQLEPSGKDWLAFMKQPHRDSVFQKICEYYKITLPQRSLSLPNPLDLLPLPKKEKGKKR